MDKAALKDELRKLSSALSELLGDIRVAQRSLPAARTAAGADFGLLAGIDGRDKQLRAACELQRRACNEWNEAAKAFSSVADLGEAETRWLRARTLYGKALSSFDPTKERPVTLDNAAATAPKPGNKPQRTKPGATAADFVAAIERLERKLSLGLINVKQAEVINRVPAEWLERVLGSPLLEPADVQVLNKLRRLTPEQLDAVLKPRKPWWQRMFVEQA